MSIVSSWWGIPTGSSPGVFVLDILDFASNTKNKTMKSFGGHAITSANSVALFSGLWRNTDPITSLTIPLSGSTQLAAGSRFSLYGIR
jgi:hypothetical protein